MVPGICRFNKKNNTNKNRLIEKETKRVAARGDWGGGNG